jgi:hypothetical protein
MTPSDELLKPGFVAFSKNLNAAISAIPHPASQTKLASVIPCRSAKINPLNPTANNDVNPLVHVLAFLYQIVHWCEGP